MHKRLEQLVEGLRQADKHMEAAYPEVLRDMSILNLEAICRCTAVCSPPTRRLRVFLVILQLMTQ